MPLPTHPPASLVSVQFSYFQLLSLLSTKPTHPTPPTIQHSTIYQTKQTNEPTKPNQPTNQPNQTNQHTNKRTTNNRASRVFLRVNLPRSRINTIFKRSSQQIYNVTMFFLFFLLLYGIVGVQLFGEMMHHCVLAVSILL